MIYENQKGPKGIESMKLRIYLAMPFLILLIAITETNWSNPLILALGNGACAIAYVTLVRITEKEIRQVSGNANEFLYQTPIDAYLPKTKVKKESISIGKLDAFSSDDTSEGYLSS
jgi:hypothetical protein